MSAAVAAAIICQIGQMHSCCCLLSNIYHSSFGISTVSCTLVRTQLPATDAHTGSTTNNTTTAANTAANAATIAAAAAAVATYCCLNRLLH
jgi:hypothetical protein